MNVFCTECVYTYKIGGGGKYETLSPKITILLVCFRGGREREEGGPEGICLARTADPLALWSTGPVWAKSYIL